MDKLSTRTKVIFGLYALAGMLLLFMSGMFFSIMLIRPLNPFVEPTAGVILLLFSGSFSLICAFWVWGNSKK